MLKKFPLRPRDFVEMCPSGRRRTLGKRLMVKAIREFESLHLRHLLNFGFFQFDLKYCWIVGLQEFNIATHSLHE
jgi:hypothetical protein